MKKMAMMFALALIGCDGTPETDDEPPCGPGTYEFRGVCLPNDGNNHPAFCGEGTHWDNNACDGNICGLCVADPATPPPPVKMTTCGTGTHLVNNECLPDNPSVEVCDGIDNNGDGQVDESDPNEGRYCEKLVPLTVGGVNKIVPTRGQLYCAHWPDGAGLLCTPNYQSVETCDNNVDDNGDGLVDEGCLDAPCQKNADCNGGLICTHPALGGLCKLPCGPLTNYAPCPTGTSCFWTWDDPACPIDQLCPTDSWTCLPTP